MGRKEEKGAKFFLLPLLSGITLQVYVLMGGSDGGSL